MIEIKAGWTGGETMAQLDVERALHDIQHYTKKIEEANKKVLAIQAGCSHKHVVFQGSKMACEVCQKELEE